MSIRKEWEEILYHLYESSGNSKYIRADHVGRPLTPDQALSALAKSLRERLPKEVQPKRKSDIAEVMTASGFNWCLKEFTSILDDLERTSDAD